MNILKLSPPKQNIDQLRKKKHQMLSLTVLIAVPILVIFASTQVRYWRYRQYAAWPQLPTSLIWGHMKTMLELIKSGASDRHPGNMPIFFPGTQEEHGASKEQNKYVDTPLKRSNC